MESSFHSQPRKSNNQRSNFASKSPSSYSRSHSTKDSKGKGKLFPEDERRLKETRKHADIKTTNPTSKSNESKSNKIKVFTIKRKDQNTLIK